MAQELKQGTRLQDGKYIIKRVLGQGGFGITYLAHQVSVNRNVAIKEFFINSNCVRDGVTGSVTVPHTGSAVQVAQFRDKFHKEAEELASFRHPHIISVLESWEENGTVYYSMPYMEGGNLNDLVKRRGKLDETTALRYISQVASALQYMHERNFCHYDVKPTNIMLDSNDDAVLIDFGISKHYGPNGMETSGTPIGLSEGFAPLEQHKSIKGFSPASDVYALGATLYFLLTGQVPPSALDLAQKATAIQFDASVSLKSRKLIESAMTTEVMNRPQNVDDFLKLQNPKPFYKRPEFIILVAIVMFAIIAYLTVTGVNRQSTPVTKVETPEVNHTDSIFQVGYNYLKGLSGLPQDYNEAVNHFRQAADEGNADAQYWLGRCYLEGWGVSVDYAESVNWFHKSAEQGQPYAQYYLGMCYKNGEGAEQDDSEAVNWFRKSANQGNADAQFWLGRCYQKGEGVNTNGVVAAKWYLKAAEQGHALAQTAMGLIYQGGEYLEENDTEAFNMFNKAANQGNAEAQYNMGLCYDHGIGVEENNTVAIEWYLKAANQGNAEAQYDLGRMYESGINVVKNLDEAIKWYSKAADGTNGLISSWANEALNRLGVE